MLSLTTTQQSIIDSKFKKIDWLFEVRDADGTVYHWSTKDISASSSQIKWNSGSWMPYVRWNSEEEYAHTFSIVDFNGIEMYRNKSEMGLIAPNTLTFTILNKDTTLIPSDFNGGTVRIALKVSDGTNAEIIRRWRFIIKKTEPHYQTFRCICEDWVQNKLRGYYPNTRLISELYPTTSIESSNKACVPVAIGTAYVPLRSVYIDAAVSITGTNIRAVASSNGSRCKFVSGAWGSDLSTVEWGRYIVVSGFTESANNGTFLVLNATSSVIELSPTAGLVTEAAGDTVTITEGARYYVLGSDDYTYTISKVRSPRAWGRKSEWLLSSSGTDWASGIAWDTYIEWEEENNFVQYTNSDGWAVFQPIIADANNDGSADSCGVWRQGETFLDMPTQFYRSDTAGFTNPADALLFILRDMGVTEIDLASFASAKATYSDWGLTWNGALWYKDVRKSILSRLLLMCHSNLVAGESIELHPISAVSKKTITETHIMKPADLGTGTFKYSDIRTEQISNCGYVEWQQSNESQDIFIKTLVPAFGSTKTEIASNVLPVHWVQDSQDVQRLGTLFFQRSLMGEAEVSFLGKSSLLALNPGDAITIEGENYGSVPDLVWDSGISWEDGTKWDGASFDCVIDSMMINKDLSINFSATKYSCSLYDFDGFSPSAISPATEDTTNAWTPAISGPVTEYAQGKDGLNTSKTYLTVGPNANIGEYSDIQEALNALASKNANGIFIKGGTYSPSQSIYFPNRDIDFIGENNARVIINMPTNAHGIVIGHVNNYNLSDFTINTGNTTGLYATLSSNYNMIRISGSASVNLKNITINCADSNANAGYGDIGVYINGTTAQLIADNIKTQNGSYGFYCTGDTIKIENCIHDKPTNIGIYCIDCGVVTIENNLVTNWRSVGIKVYGAAPIYKTSVSGNTLSSLPDSDSANPSAGIWMENGYTSTICRNKINHEHLSRTFLTSIYLYNCDNSIVDGNVCDLVATSTDNSKTIAITQSQKLVISNNSIKHDCYPDAGEKYGIYASASDYMTINANHINMTYSEAEEHPILFAADVSYSIVSGNVMEKYGTLDAVGDGTNTYGDNEGNS